MTLVFWIWIGLTILGTIAFSALVWFAGPIISVGDVEPFESVWLRLTIILILWVVVLAIIAWRIIRRRRAAAKLEHALTEPVVDETDAPVLAEKMRDALATLKNSSKNGGNTLYDLPWYLIIGPPGAGKTTALINSGLKFPLANDSAARAVQGVGGTRYCDWWFTDQAVLIDTAGRYTTQDSDAKLDRKSWLAFLDMLRSNRPRQPINGVLVAISIEDVLKLPLAEVNAHADAIRKRLAELNDELKVDFPVYAVFTKMDLIVGFTPYFADLDETKRQAVWGATFQTADKKANNVVNVPAEIDLLAQRLAERMPERLQEEPDLRSRAMLFGLPAQIGAIKKPVGDFLNRIFEPTRYQTSATLRGFYLTSGTQEGTPFDQVIGALQKSYGVESFGAAAFSGAGKSFFLHDLLAKVVFGEAGWVSTNMAAVRRSFALRAAMFSLIALATAAVLGAWWLSYSGNTALIASTDRAVDSYAAAAGPLLKQNTVNDPDLRPVYEQVGALLNLPAGYAARDEGAPLSHRFGLNQQPRVLEASEATYRQSLERLMRPRLVLRLERQIQKNVTDPSFIYEALKVYLMLGGKAPSIDKNLIVDWFARDWEEQYPGAPYKRGRDLLRDHLVAMLDLDSGSTPKVSLNGPLVEQAQATLARMRVAERAYTLLKSEARGPAAEDWVAARRGGPDMALVFEATNGASLDTVRVPAFFTYNGFYAALLAHMTDIADKLQKEQWVLGQSGDQTAVKQQYASMMPDIIDLYGKEFLAAWNVALGNLQLRSLIADAPKYLALSAASAPTSPLKQIFESIRDETSLTRERKAAGGNSAVKTEAKDDAASLLRSKLGSTGGEALNLALKSQRKAGDPPAEVPGASIEANFKPFQVLVDGEPGARPIDNLLANLNELYRNLTLAAANPAQAKQARDQADVQVASLRSNVTRLPQPLAGMMDKVASDVAHVDTAASIEQLTRDMAEQVTGPCQKVTTNFYPFAKSERDVPMADFARMFAPNGVIDKFFAANLAPLVNTTGKTWVWRPNPQMTRKLSDTTLRQFQQSADIRDAFFPTGANAPMISLEVKPLTLSGEATGATLTINGAAVASVQGTNAPVNVQWPGAGAGAASIAILPDLPDHKSTLDRTGAWALFRLLDAGSVLQHGNSVSASFVIGGRETSYQFTAASLSNPLSLPALRQFKCPNGL